MAKKGAKGGNTSAESSNESAPTSSPSLPEKRASSGGKGEKVHFEFGGPIGACGVIFGLPVVIYLLFFLCNDQVCLKDPRTFDWQGWVASLPSLSSLFSWRASALVCGWMALQVFLERVLPGALVEGVPLPNKSRLSYTMSGHLQFWISLVLLTHGHVVFNVLPGLSSGSFLEGVLHIKSFHSFPLEVIYDEYLGLITASVILSFSLAIYLYRSSFWGPKGKILAKGGDTGYAIYDFFIGRELNPRIGSLDLKEFCELRPGLVGWLVINLAMAVKQWQKNAAATGEGFISLSMALTVLLQGIYVWDAQYNEQAILSTMDITTDGFGFMLAFGDLSWVPFIYTLQARYLVDYDPALSLWQIAAIMAVHMLGFYIFRSANSEKDSFRRDPTAVEVRHLQFMDTKRGTKLLTSGWWGMARKINYTGDWLITLSWCLLCGFRSPIPYFQAIYFAVLLVHRAMRDDMMCKEKYGADWDEYKRRVPYLFIPYII